MDLKQIAERLAAIKEILSKGEGDLDALQQEIESLETERTKIINDNQKRSDLLKQIANNDIGISIRRFEKIENDDEFDFEKSVSSDVYKRAFLKTLVNDELTVQERKMYDDVNNYYRAYTHTTDNTKAVVAKGVVNEIVSLIEEEHPILGDITILRSGAVFTIAKHKSIDSGDAKNVAEGVANDDEQNTFEDVTLVGQDISKHIEYSYALGIEAISAFETYLETEIADRIGAQWAKNVVAQIKKDLNATNKITSATPGTLVETDVKKALASIKTKGTLICYTTNETLWNNISELKGADGKLAYVPNYFDGLKGMLFGAGIKQEDALLPGEILFLDSKKYVENIIQDILIERDKEIKRHVHVIAGYMRTSGTLKHDKAGALISIGVGA